MIAVAELKNQAKRLRKHLVETHNLPLSHSAALEAIASIQGFKNWDTLVGVGSPSTTNVASPYQTRTATINGVNHNCYQPDDWINRLEHEAAKAMRSEPDIIRFDIDSSRQRGDDLFRYPGFADLLSSLEKRGVKVELSYHLQGDPISSIYDVSPLSALRGERILIAGAIGSGRSTIAGLTALVAARQTGRKILWLGTDSSLDFLGGENLDEIRYESILTDNLSERISDVPIEKTILVMDGVFSSTHNLDWFTEWAARAAIIVATGRPKSSGNESNQEQIINTIESNGFTFDRFSLEPVHPVSRRVWPFDLNVKLIYHAR
ncbi:glyoxalase superfamily protein [Crenobacter sp. SG2305]|uniref:glyoxalase superfamily protein n=1 Tax=Crenobacter oryzisoli TaxID=3056844 RepID=UPI0025AAF28E|nr:glyoxalase superfamily protein [Crenobacter sp. SG2305]MDN0082430.1 glyoxalase superfamily protein [Crenobacter sp. SG2305]